MRRRRSLLEIARPRDDGSGYDHAAIARALSFAERYTLGEVAAGMAPSNMRAAKQLQAAGLVIVCPAGVELSMLGDDVIEYGLVALFVDAIDG